LALRGVVELLEADGEPVFIRPISPPSWHYGLRSLDALEAEFKKRPVVDIEQPIGDMNSKIGADDASQIRSRFMAAPS
jgi:hypothetical protein